MWDSSARLLKWLSDDDVQQKDTCTNWTDVAYPEIEGGRLFSKYHPVPEAGALGICAGYRRGHAASENVQEPGGISLVLEEHEPSKE